MISGDYSGTKQIIVVSVFLFLATIFVLLRLVIRRTVLGTFGVDDGLICAAYSLSFALFVLIIIEVQHGQGLTDSVISHEDVMELRHIIWMSFPVFFASLVFTKISILCLYLRFFQEKSLRYFTIGLISFVAAYAVVSICTTIFICTPVSAFWDSAAGGRCMDRKIIWMTNAAVDMLTNLITLTLPMYTLYHLKLPRKQRFGLIGVFGLAIFAVAICAARMHALFSLIDSLDTACQRCHGSAGERRGQRRHRMCLPVLRATLVRVADRLSSHRPSRGLLVAPNWQDISITEMGKEDTTRREDTKRSIDCSTCASASTDGAGGITRSVCITQSTSTKLLEELPLSTLASPAGRGQLSRRMSEVWDGGVPGVSSRITGHECV
ncbi:hypothetical protein BDV97DRAFT_112808 [Delphinella strobiligena]|nr:hypothetical protein BDV97DRAFT_112808 [Delphinella strobiligena]